MACELERQAVANAMLALDTSIAAVDAAVAVMKSNMLALQTAQQNLAICEFGQTQPPTPPGP